MKRVFKWLGLGLAGLVVLLLVAVTALYFVGSSKVDAAVAVDDEALTIPTDSATLARGKYLVTTHACQECHGATFEGRVFADAPPFLAVATNLTPGKGGIGAAYTAADWERAIRHGIGADGRGLNPIMPSKLYHALSDDEITAMIAYLQTLPPVDNELPPSEFRPLGRVIAGTGGLYTASAEIDHAAVHPSTAPPHAATVDYGRHRTRTLCTYCHGADFQGGPPVEPGTPPTPPLNAVTGWTLEEFATTMRTGVTPGGKELNPVVMPWKAFQHMDDAEIEALYRYLTEEALSDTATMAASH
ncbi:MAG: c-type cytochrome [Bacteroidetes bacterium]|jgi:cytochrome c553|nr:c-type cytochrome [Bacteroidota bacterium]